MPKFLRSELFHEVYLIQSEKYADERGFFMESFRETWLSSIAPGVQFVQDNHSLSHQGVLRGLHYQLEQPQGKLVRVIRGKIYDVIVDMRQSSPTFARWQGFYLDAEQNQQLWIPAGFAHGFYTVTEQAECLYRCTNYYHKESEYCLRYDDPALAIRWPFIAPPNLSIKDQQGHLFAHCPYFA